MAANPSLLELIRPLVEYQARVGRRVTFVLLGNQAGVDHTFVYALRPTEPQFETDEPLLKADGRQFYFAWRADDLITEIITRYTPQWGPVFQLSLRAAPPVRVP
jgi:hypothetical protein